MKHTKLNIVAAAVLSLGVLAGCNSGSSEAVAYYTDIVTLDSSNERGSVMSYREINDSPVITLTTTTPLSQEARSASVS